MTPALRPLDVPLGGVTVVEASAGTGKTFTLTTLYLRLLLEQNLRPGEILVVTYTNAATAELHTRVRSRMVAAIEAFRGTSPRGDEDLAELVERRLHQGTAAADERQLAAALYAFDDAAIFTIHGFCQRVLQDHAFESGAPFEAQLVTDQRALVREIVRDFWSRELHAAPASFARYLRDRSGGNVTPIEDLVSLALIAVAQPDMPVLPPVAEPDMSVLPLVVGRAVRAETASGPPSSPQNDTDAAAHYLALQRALIDHVRHELPRRKEEAGIQYFDDLLTRLRDALAGGSGEALAGAIRRRYAAALIDEFQDTDPIQYEIFRRVYEGSGKPLFLIGDPKQAIYAFRGADVFTYVEAKGRAEAAHTLSRNHRSDPTLLRAVNALFSRPHRSFLLDGIAFEEARPVEGRGDWLGGSWTGQPPLALLYLRGKKINKGDGVKRIARAIAADIARCLDQGAEVGGAPLRPDHIAVLCRTNDQAHRMQRELRALGVPSVLQTDTSVFETAEAEELERIVRALAEPADSRAVIAALATPLLGVGAGEISAMRAGSRQWDEWTDRFHRLHAVWTVSGFIPALRGLLDETAIAEHVLAAAGGERRLTNLLHLAEILQNAAGETQRGPLALAEWLAEMRANREARREDVEGEVAQIRLESDDRAVELITVHKAKGLEYPVVYCPFLWDGRLLRSNDARWIRFHDASADNRLTMDIGPDAKTVHGPQAEHEALAESLRLLYVALTRAKHRCVVVWGRFNEAETSPLAYLLHQPAPALSPPANGRELAAAVKARVKGLDDEQMIADLESLGASAAGAIEVREMDESHGEPYRGGAQAAPALECPPLARVLRPTWRTSSFSGLVAGGTGLSHAAEEGIDRDDTDEGATASASEAAVIPLAEFPAGTRAGQLVHSVFETLDFGATPMEVRAAVAIRLAAFGFDPVWRDSLARAIGDVLATPLHDGQRAFSLSEVAPAARLNELEFLFPVLEAGGPGTVRSTAAGGTAEAGFRSDHLAAVFERHAGETPGRGYVERLRHLGFAPLAGFLKGFIDLAFEHRGRWYVLDYKSNHLGARPERYHPAALAAAMAHHHYYLQYHLYTVALHRHLTMRLGGYRYDRHFGGVFYLFVRGMSPTYAPGNGVFFDRPPRALIEGLSAALAAGMPS